MNYEKKYKEALERARKLKENPQSVFNEYSPKEGDTICDYIFPELAESEDERIRKELIAFLKTYDTFFTSRYISWLEKQSQTFTKKDVDDAYLKGISDAKNELEKQDGNKPTDKVEPKFKVGDWIIDKQGITHQIKNVIENVTNHTFGYDLVSGGYFNEETEGVRIWTIQDAKEGDILFQDLMGGKTFIYNGVNPNMAILYSFIISNDGEDVLPYHIGKPNTGIGNIEENKNIIHPATKEQRNTLIKAMADAGLEFDFEKKELKKIEQKSAWSEEDEKNLQGVIDEIEANKDYAESCDIPAYDRCLNWLKSLKDRYIWKPSNEQIGALEDAMYQVGILTPLGSKINDLYDDLKKLTE